MMVMTYFYKEHQIKICNFHINNGYTGETAPYYKTPQDVYNVEEFKYIKVHIDLYMFTNKNKSHKQISTGHKEFQLKQHLFQY